MRRTCKHCTERHPGDQTQELLTVLYTEQPYRSLDIKPLIRSYWMTGNSSEEEPSETTRGRILDRAAGIREESDEEAWLGYLLDASLVRCSRHIPSGRDSGGKTQDSLMRLTWERPGIPQKCCMKRGKSGLPCLGLLPCDPTSKRWMNGWKKAFNQSGWRLLQVWPSFLFIKKESLVQFAPQNPVLFHKSTDALKTMSGGNINRRWARKSKQLVCSP